MRIAAQVPELIGLAIMKVIDECPDGFKVVLRIDGNGLSATAERDRQPFAGYKLEIFEASIHDALDACKAHPMAEPRE